MIKKNLINERNERKNKFEKIEKTDKLERSNAVLNNMLNNLNSIQQDLVLKLSKDPNPGNLKTMNVNKSDNKSEKMQKSPILSSKILPKTIHVRSMKEEENRISNSSNKIITVDLSTPKVEVVERRLMRNYVNTKVVNLDLSAINDNPKAQMRRQIKEKTFDRSKSDKLFDLNSRSESVRRKFVHVPTVKTSLYTESEVLEQIRRTNAAPVSRNSSVSLKTARSLSKAQRNSSANESLNDSEVSLCLSDNNVNFNFNLMKIKLDEIKRVMQPMDDSKPRRSVSPIKINYGSLKINKSFKDSLKESTPTSKSNLTAILNDTNEEVIQILYANNSTEERPLDKSAKGSKVILQNYINFQSNGKQNIRFLNLVRSRKKKLDDLFKL